MPGSQETSDRFPLLRALHQTSLGAPGHLLLSLRAQVDASLASRLIGKTEAVMDYTFCHSAVLYIVAIVGVSRVRCVSQRASRGRYLR